MQIPFGMTVHRKDGQAGDGWVVIVTSRDGSICTPTYNSSERKPRSLLENQITNVTSSPTVYIPDTTPAPPFLIRLMLAFGIAEAVT